MNDCHCAQKPNEEGGACRRKMSAASTSDQTDNLFRILAEAESSHHDALVELTGDIRAHACQFKVLQACLLKTSPGKA